jgi:glutathione synthase/RimK-type ligase-like ATP-grasp enzyme
MSALSEAGIDATLLAWDDDTARWDEFGLCVIRSTWNYPEFPSEFCRWVHECSRALPMLNPSDVVLANVDKRYLFDFQAQGIPIVPSELFLQGTTEALERWRNRTFVVKPTVSAGSWMTRKFTPIDFERGVAFLNNHLQSRDMMVQPYIDSVEQGGEVAWVWIDGEVTHGVRKSPRFEEDAESVSEAVMPTPEASAIVGEIMSRVDADLLYARVDLIESGGESLLSELELIEPSLFFMQNTYALERFVGAVKRRIA